MKNFFKVIVINFMVFSTVIVAMEITGQLGYFIKKGEFLINRTSNSINSRVFEIHPFLAGRPKASAKVTQNDKTITTTSYHTRWTGAKQDDHELIKIAVLGGSTAFGTGVTDKDSWPALLQEKLGTQYAVINYGVPGYSTAENIIQMALLVPEKRPHIVVFYEGWNDIRNYHETGLSADYYGHGMRQYGNLGISVSNQKTTFERFEDIFVTVRLAGKVKKIIEEYTDPTKNDIELFDTPDQFVDSIYVRNLNTLKLLTENIRAFAVFVPQILNYEAYYGKAGSYEWTRHIKNEATPILMDKFNNLINKVCSEGEHTCIVLRKVLEEKWLPDDFVDNGHFSKSGGLKFAEKIAQFIRSKYSSEYFNNVNQRGAP